jgi:hypothetical protein
VTLEKELRKTGKDQGPAGKDKERLVMITPDRVYFVANHQVRPCPQSRCSCSRLSLVEILSVSLCPCLSSVSPSASLRLSLVCLTVFVDLPLSLCLSFSVCLPLSVALSVSLCLILCVSLSCRVSLCVSPGAPLPFTAPCLVPLSLSLSGLRLFLPLPPFSVSPSSRALG